MKRSARVLPLHLLTLIAACAAPVRPTGADVAREAVDAVMPSLDVRPDAPGDAGELDEEASVPPLDAPRPEDSPRVDATGADATGADATGADATGADQPPPDAARLDGGVVVRRPRLGAIRWDAWQENASVNAHMERTLAPAHWHDRIPFFGSVEGDGGVRIRGGTGPVMDAEIAYAVRSGLQYWAFVAYPPRDPMSRGLELYLASTRRSDIQFCLVLQGSWLARDPDPWSMQVARYVELFRNPEHVRVAGGRPLLYLLDPSAMWGTSRFPDRASARAALDALRAASVDAGQGDPYVVLQGGQATADAATASALGLDALSAYALGGGADGGAPFRALTDSLRALWSAQARTGHAVVPLLSAGWDPRPRIENPVPWASYPSQWYLAPSPSELADQVALGFDWMRAHPDASPADVLLLYAWNEHDEGGWVCPTLTPGAPDTARVAAVAAGVARGATPPAPVTAGLANGGFESPASTAPWYVVPAEGVDRSFGWSNGARGGAYLIADARARHFDAAAEGTRALLLSAADWIHQDWGPVAAGDVVELRFSTLTGAYPGDPPGALRATLLVDGRAVATADAATPAAAGTWEAHALSATAASAGVLSVRFESRAGMSWLDAVTVARR